MSFKANAITVLVSYANCTVKQKEQVVRAIYEWNTIYSKHLENVLLPNMMKREEDVSEGHLEKRECFKNHDYVIYIDTKKNFFKHNMKSLEVLGQENSLSLFSKNIVIFINEYSPKNKNKEHEDIIESLLYLVDRNIKNSERTILDKTFTSKIKKLSKKQIAILDFALEQKNIFFYPKWVSVQTVNKIEEWEEAKNEHDSCLKSYDDLLNQLASLNFLKISQFTEYGNGRMFELPLDVLYQLQQYKLCEIEKISNLRTLDM